MDLSYAPELDELVHSWKENHSVEELRRIAPNLTDRKILNRLMAGVDFGLITFDEITRPGRGVQGIGGNIDRESRFSYSLNWANAELRSAIVLTLNHPKWKMQRDFLPGQKSSKTESVAPGDLWREWTPNTIRSTLRTLIDGTAPNPFMIKRALNPTLTYCGVTYRRPIGEEFDLPAATYGLTDHGRQFGSAIALRSLELAMTLGSPIQSVFGKSHKEGRNRGPYIAARLLELIKSGVRTRSELEEALDVTPGVVINHVQRLNDAGVIRYGIPKQGNPRGNGKVKDAAHQRMILTQRSRPVMKYIREIRGITVGKDVYRHIQEDVGHLYEHDERFSFIMSHALGTYRGRSSTGHTPRETREEEIREFLESGEKSVRDIAGHLQIREPSVRVHVRRMRESGRVHVRVDGNARWYSNTQVDS